MSLSCKRRVFSRDLSLWIVFEPSRFNCDEHTSQIFIGKRHELGLDIFEYSSVDETIVTNLTLFQDNLSIFKNWLFYENNLELFLFNDEFRVDNELANVEFEIIDDEHYMNEEDSFFSRVKSQRLVQLFRRELRNYMVQHGNVLACELSGAMNDVVYDPFKYVVDEIAKYFQSFDGNESDLYHLLGCFCPLEQGIIKRSKKSKEILCMFGSYVVIQFLPNIMYVIIISDLVYFLIK